MKHIAKSELEAQAKDAGLAVHYECGGCRVIDSERRDVFPPDGICKTVPKREAFIFLTGYVAGLKTKLK